MRDLKPTPEIKELLALPPEERRKAFIDAQIAAMEHALAQRVLMDCDKCHWQFVSGPHVGGCYLGLAPDRCC